MADFKVKVDSLNSLGTELMVVYNHLDQVEDTMSVESAAGHDGVEEAFHDFCNNWDRKRKKICDLTKNLSECVIKAGEFYTKNENELVAGIKGE